MTSALSRTGIALGAFSVSLGAGALIGIAVMGDSSNAVPIAVERAAVSPSAPAVHRVALTHGGAMPAAVIARLGDQVRFDAADGRRHSIAQGAGKDFGEEHGHAVGVESPEFGEGESYLVSITEPGLYFFHDHEHPELTVSVVVYDAAAE